MNKAEIDAVMAACLAWVRQHHRATLQVSEASEIRRALTQRARDPFAAAPAIVDLVRLAHGKANEIIGRRRDRAQRAEHQRVARP